MSSKQQKGKAEEKRNSLKIEIKKLFLRTKLDPTSGKIKNQLEVVLQLANEIKLSPNGHRQALKAERGHCAKWDELFSHHCATELD